MPPDELATDDQDDSRGRRVSGKKAAEFPERTGRTPAEVRDGILPARERVRFEPRARMPLARGHPRVERCRKLELRVSYVDGHKELPVVELLAA